MLKNVAGQTARVYAFDPTTGLPKTGDAANLTAYAKLDGGAIAALADTTAAEVDATNAKGWYEFGLGQAETNGNQVLVTGKSITANVVVVGQDYATLPNGISTLDAAAVRGAMGLGSANLDTQLGAIASYIDTEVTTLLSRLGVPAGASVSADIAAAVSTVVSAIPSSASNASAVLAAVVEGSTTLVQSLRMLNAVLGGKASGLGTATAVYRDLGDSKARITATVDAEGNRTAITRDLT